jgi:plasmid stability protein
MAQVLIRNLPEDIVERLRARAVTKGHSLEHELRQIITAAAPLTTQEKLALVDRIRAMTPEPVAHDSTDFIRQDRDER